MNGTGVHAYILDTGIRSTHVDFGGRVRAGYSSINDGRGTSDCNGHGTHTAGTVGSKPYGAAKKVNLYPVRVLNCFGSGTTSGVIAGVDWVTSNHRKPAVANMSLGGSASTSLDDAVTRSIAAGVTYAIAAGQQQRRRLLHLAGARPDRVDGRRHELGRQPRRVLQLRWLPRPVRPGRGGQVDLLQLRHRHAAR